MFTALLVAFLAAQAADAATTAWRLQQPGIYREANPLLPQHLGLALGLKASVTVGTAVLAWHWRDRHPKAAATVLILGTAVGSYAAWHNLRLAPPGRRP